MKTCLGIELGSTRIKAVAVGEDFCPVSSGDYTWISKYENGVWTYPLEEVWTGLMAALTQVENRQNIAAMGVSAMMHGYLAFDKDWNLLTPFRTWQNTITGVAAAELTALFDFNIPQRWSIAHLYQAVLNGEEHVSQIAHITTLAGYVHYMLTGVNAVGIGEASGMFPIDSAALDYDAGMLAKFDALSSVRSLPWKLRDLLPKVLTAGEPAGILTESGAALLDGLLTPGIPFAPAEGDAGTGMTATNAVASRTGNVSAGTSIFSSVSVTYRLEGGALHLFYRAVTDRTTICNLTNHAYFNLNGHDAGGAMEQLLSEYAGHYTPVGPGSIPTGEIAPVEGTPMDFRTPWVIGVRIDEAFRQLELCSGYDHNWVVDGESGTLRPAARLESRETGICMEVETTLPGIQFYAGNYMAGCPAGKSGAQYGRRDAVCLETQFFPDTPNHLNFPQCILRPGEAWEHETVFRFSGGVKG